MSRRWFSHVLLGCSAVALAACATPTAVAPTDETACAEAGGKWRTAGTMQVEVCEIRFPDAGKTCTDGSECAGGQCLTDAVPADQAGSAATGICKPSNVTDGCYSEVQYGRTQAGQCAE